MHLKQRTDTVLSVSSAWKWFFPSWHNCNEKDEIRRTHLKADVSLIKSRKDWNYFQIPFEMVINGHAGYLLVAHMKWFLVRRMRCLLVLFYSNTFLTSAIPISNWKMVVIAKLCSPWENTLMLHVILTHVSSLLRSSKWKTEETSLLPRNGANGPDSQDFDWRSESDSNNIHICYSCGAHQTNVQGMG